MQCNVNSVITADEPRSLGCNDTAKRKKPVVTPSGFTGVTSHLGWFVLHLLKMWACFSFSLN